MSAPDDDDDDGTTRADLELDIGHTMLDSAIRLADEWAEANPPATAAGILAALETYLKDYNDKARKG